MQRTEKIIEINAPVERVFDLFSDFESFPRWMSHIKEVRYTGRRYTRWKAEAPLGSSVEWEAETIRFEPDRRIAWRSVRGDVETEGEVVFRETGHGTTLLRVRLGYDPPAGRLGAALARLFGTNPEEQLEEDLERFAAVAEGPRRSRHTDARRNFDVEERYRSGATREAEASAYRSDERALRPDAHRNPRASSRRDRRERERGYESRGGYEDHPLPFEPARRDRFDRELREALSSQRESMRRYDEERRLDAQRDYREGYERDEQRFARDERRRRGPADERRLYEGRMRHHTPQRGEDDRRHAPPTPARHALTPRERELERTRRRRPDSDYPGKALGRGVDKLLDEEDAPSKRWRRW